MRKIGSHAVVLGAGLAGLLAGRVLADAYERVTVVERDPLPPATHLRRGVPQGRHAHNLLRSGAAVIDALLPGVLDDLESDGAPVVRTYAEITFAPAGHRLRLDGQPAQPLFHLPSRPFLEERVRERVWALPALDVADQCEATGLTTNSTRDRVTGVRITRRGGDTDENLDADLVVDATGRGGRTATWLPMLGYEPPPEERLQIDVVYATRHLRRHPGDLGGRKFIAFGANADRPAGFVMFAQEHDRWILTLIGYGSQRPPTDPEGFLAFVRAIAPSDVFSAIRDAEPLDDIVAFRFPANVRRRYERLRRFPSGLLVIGDAVCSTNPSYGIGMSSAALQAAALHDCLAGGGRRLAHRYFRAAAKRIEGAWQITTGTDLTLRHVRGPRPVSVRVVNAYIERLLTAAEHDPAVAERFIRVATLQSPTTGLFHPGTAIRVLRGSRRRGPVPTTGAMPHETTSAGPRAVEE